MPEPGPPTLEVLWLSSEPDGDLWRVAWRVRNAGADAVKIDSAYAPHSLFRAPQVALDRTLGPGRTTEVSFSVRVDASAGPIENPFLIVKVELGDRAWLVLARARVDFEDGRPVLAVPVVTVQPVGFSRDTGRDADGP